jgi:hypothetical protein
MIFTPGMRIQIEQHTGDLVQGVVSKIEGQWITVRWEQEHTKTTLKIEGQRLSFHAREQFNDLENTPLPDKVCHVDFLTKRLRG